MAFFKKTRKTSNRRRKGKLSFIVPWAKRFGLSLAVLALSTWLGSWFFLSGAAQRTSDHIQIMAVNLGAHLGFRVDNILLEGRINSDAEVILALINTKKGEPLFAFDPDAARTQMERISWIEKAEIERRLPGTIYIRLTERQPLAFWQESGKLRLIDTKGKVINADKLDRFKDRVIVMGAGAKENAPFLIANLLSEPELYKRVEAAKRISNRRWDLVLKNKTTVKLPETDMELAITRLARAQSDDSLLDKDIEHIDLRNESRMIVRTRPGAVKEYKASLKAPGSNI